MFYGSKKKTIAPERTETKREKVGYKHPPKEYQFKPGNSGRPKGTKNFSTLFEQAIRKIVKEKKIKGLKNPEIELVTKAIIEGLKGNYAYYRDTMDRKYGKPTQPLEHSGQVDLKMKAIEKLTEAVKQLAEK